MSGVTIMILIVLLITILMSYVLYCDPDTNPDLASISNLMSPSIVLTDPECQNIKSPQPFQVSNIRISLFVEYSGGICSICVTLTLLHICSLVWTAPPGSPVSW